MKQILANMIQTYGIEVKCIKLIILFSQIYPITALNKSNVKFN